METSFEAADAAIARLAQHKQTWICLTIEQRLHYLHRCIDLTLAVAERWAQAACEAKGIDPNASLGGEEWVTGPTALLLNLRYLSQSLAAKGQPQPVAMTTQANGQLVAQVFPDSCMDRLLWLGFKGEVWIEPGKPPTQGFIYREPPPTGRVALVLGAGNIAAIAPMDALYKLFVEGEVVLLKMNPVNEYLGPILEQALQPLLDDGFLAVVYGGAELGRYLCHHPTIESVHITGSHRTHDAIVWGTAPDEQQQRKVANQPLLTKPITSELGCVTPILVVPGAWSDADLRYQAHHVASMVVHNASFNCVAAKVVVTATGWKQREAFLAQLHQALAQSQVRKAYYPGAQQRYQAFLDRYPQAQGLGDRTEEIVPWTVIPQVSPQPNEYALREEAFCGVLAEVTLETADAASFLTRAPEFANQTVWGNLSCVLLIDPKTQRRHPKELEGAIAALRYGGIGVNVWTGMNFLLPSVTWGAFPDNSLSNIRSGRGVVHNTYLFEHPQKSVVYSPFRPLTKPIYFAGHRNLLHLAKQFSRLQVKPSWSRFVQVVLAAFQA